MLKSKRAIVGIAAAAVVVGLTLASMAVATTSGAGTDTNPTSTATKQPTVAPTATAIPAAPPQAPVEPPAAVANTNTGDQEGVGTLPSTGFGDNGSGGNGDAMLLLVLAGVVLAAGTALTLAGGMPGRKK